MRLSFVALIFLLFSNVSCYAIELGPITSYSYLDEPFSAEIEVLDLNDTNLSTIKARLQSKADLKLQCDVEIVKNRAFLHIWSAVYIEKSFLELVVNLAAADQKITKSYTLLLDPAPAYMVNRQLTHEMLQQDIIAKRLAKEKQVQVAKALLAQQQQIQQKNIQLAQPQQQSFIKKYQNKIDALEFNLTIILIAAAIVIIFIAFICIIYFICSKNNKKHIVTTAQSGKTLAPKSNKKTADNKMLVIKLKLARQYIALGDTESARNLLQGVIREGSPSLQEQAKAELARLL